MQCFSPTLAQTQDLVSSRQFGMIQRCPEGRTEWISHPCGLCVLSQEGWELFLQLELQWKVFYPYLSPSCRDDQTQWLPGHVLSHQKQGGARSSSGAVLLGMAPAENQGEVIAPVLSLPTLVPLREHWWGSDNPWELHPALFAPIHHQQQGFSTAGAAVPTAEMERQRDNCALGIQGRAICLAFEHD